MLQPLDKFYEAWYTRCMLNDLILNIYFFGYTTGSVPCMKEIIHAQYRVKKLLGNGGFFIFFVLKFSPKLGGFVSFLN